ncbi:MAG TPA: glycosyltransferase, partial [Luteolibacter sp.]
WWWATALSQFFHLHVITQKPDVDACLKALGPEAEDWTFHSTVTEMETWAFPQGYIRYWQWAEEALSIAGKIQAAHPIKGLCHVILGSFRVLPRYDRLGLPYTVGPLGGGECAPPRYLQGRSAPWRHRLVETIRPLANSAFCLIPRLRKCLGGAAVVFATSEETGLVLQRMGAKQPVVVFPDAYDAFIDTTAIMENRTGQQEEVGKHIRLLWQGRALWWKCPDLALDILARALEVGIRLNLTMVGDWNGAVGQAVKQQAERLELMSHVRFIAGMPRAEFLELQASHHGFLATSLHDSGGIPLIEAQARGLPCFTLGLGGNRQAVCPQAGVPDGGASPAEFVENSVSCLRRWQSDPRQWLGEAEAALHYSTTFTNARLQTYVREHVVEAFSS